MPRPLLIALGTAASVIAIAPIGLFACSDREERAMQVRQELRTFDAEEAPPPVPMSAAVPSMPAPPAPPPPSPPPVVPASPSLPSLEHGEPPEARSVATETAPRIAYTYGYRFRLAADRVAALQERHLALCRQLGDLRCRIVALHRAEQRPDPRATRDQPAEAAASLQLQIIAPLAERFGQTLTESGRDAGAGTPDRTIAADDVSRQMVDSEARIRTRETLIRRLSTLLETRSGNIEQAVQAERAINQAQEELDAARNWLADTRGRVAMSKFEIVYEAGLAPADSRNPLAVSMERIGAVTTQSFAVILLIAGVALPWLLIGLFVAWAARRHRLRHGTQG